LETLSLEVLLLLTAAGSIAGLLDAMAGGGGLIALPTLLAVGLDPAQALATNKLQGSFGTLSSTLHFARKGEVQLARLRPAILFTFLGAAAGTIAVQTLESEQLARIIPWLLIAFATYFLFSPRVGDLDAHQRIGLLAFAILIGTTLGFYDGFFGPGTGSFFAIACVALLGYNLRRATATTKVLNFTSNIASLIFFILGGKVVWVAGLCMGLGQSAGAWLGAHLVLRHGAALVRPMLVLVSLAITLSLWIGNGAAG